jgi:hypothetical protein
MSVLGWAIKLLPNGGCRRIGIAIMKAGKALILLQSYESEKNCSNLLSTLDIHFPPSP